MTTENVNPFCVKSTGFLYQNHDAKIMNVLYIGPEYIVGLWLVAVECQLDCG